MIVNHDAAMMRLAYAEALSASGNSDPNPAVGAIVVAQNGTILARGFTQRAGFAHAERNALQKIATSDLAGATLYVTLEPCCHHGRTPPCTDIILDRKIGRVVVAERDYASEVMGRSVELLRTHGVDVLLYDDALFEREAWFTTGPFFFTRKYNRPRLMLKWAQTIDGSLAPQSGASGAISGKAAAYLTAALRSYAKLTAASPGTVKIDSPKLTVRFDENKPSLQESGLTPFFQNLIEIQHRIATTKNTDKTAVRPPEQLFLAASKVTALDAEQTLHFAADAWQGDFATTMQKIFAQILSRGFNSVLVEAGPNFSELLFEHDFVDTLAVYRSKNNSSASLWGSPGRGNRVSRVLAKAQSSSPPLTGFELVECGDLGNDDFLLFRRLR